MVRQPRGNALLVGVGGTGKQSLTRLAAHMCGYKCFQIELTRGYNYETFHEDLKKLYIMTGVKDENTVFLFTDTQVWKSMGFAAKIWEPKADSCLDWYLTFENVGINTFLSFRS